MEARSSLGVKLLTSLMVVGALCWAGSSQAGLIGYDASVVAVLPEAPPSVEYTALQSGAVGNPPYNEQSWVFYFEEQQDVLLELDIPVNVTEPGHYTRPLDLAGVMGNSDLPYPVLEAGTVVDSHFLHLDVKSGPRLEGFVEFDTDIVGVIFFDAEREIFAPSDLLFGAPGTLYPDMNVRDLELRDGDWIWLSDDLRTLTFSMRDGSCGFDQIRILTGPPIPEPHALGLFCAGALIVGAAIRRRRSLGD